MHDLKKSKFKEIDVTRSLIMYKWIVAKSEL